MRSVCFFLSIIAFALSAMAFFGKYDCNGIPNVILSLIGICCTLIVGVSVVDSITVHNIQKQINKLDDTQIKQEKQEEHLKVLIEEQKSTTYISNQISWGLATLSMQPTASFGYFVKGLEKSLETNNVKAIGICLHCMEQVPKIMKRKENDSKHHISVQKETPQLSEGIKELETYKLIAERVENVFLNMEKYYEKEDSPNSSK